MIHRKSSSQSGFTLIELLVVVALIGLLASIVLIALQKARVKSRDAKRISDLRQIVSALELYYDANGSYPPSSCSGGYDCNGYYWSSDSSWNTLQTYLSPYLKTLPKDPLNSQGCQGPWNVNCYAYSYGNVGNSVYPPQYDLTALLEDTSSLYRCEIKNYKYNFGTQNWCTAFGGGYSNQIYEASIK